MVVGQQIQFDGVRKDFGEWKSVFTAVQDISLAVRTGEFVTIIGPSGCGKSTLLNMAAGLMRPSAGSVTYKGKVLSRINTDVGYVTQRDSTLPWRTVWKNVSLPLELQGVRRAERNERTRQAIAMVGLSGFEDRYPSQLSGGMRKRVGLAQTFVYKPSTLLMDEPFASLDAQLRMELQQELLDLWVSNERTTVMFVTHDLEEAILLGDRVVVFGTKPGRIIHIEEIQFERPRRLTELRADSAFGVVWNRLWGLLEAEVESNS